jgi:predicted ATP-grasp superfamily ATP-dependent carboligase
MTFMRDGQKASMTHVFVYEYLSGGGLIPSAHDATVSDEAAAAELLPLGLSMRDALAQDLLQLEGVQLSVAASPRAPRVPGNAEPVRPRADESAFDFVARQAALHDVAWVVAPETGGLLARMQQVVGPERWLGCAAPAIAVASGKRATLMQLAAHGVATPLAFEHVPEVQRWVVKPDDGAGAVATRVHRSQDEAMVDWDQRSKPGSPMAIEPWVDGEPLSVSLLCKARGTEMLSVNRQRIAVDEQGALSFEGVDVNAIALDSHQGRALSALASQVVNSIPGLRGFVGIDVVWHPRCGPVVIEVNPRITCAYVGLSAALKRNLAGELLADHAVGSLHD